MRTGQNLSEWGGGFNRELRGAKVTSTDRACCPYRKKRALRAQPEVLRRDVRCAKRRAFPHRAMGRVTTSGLAQRGPFTAEQNVRSQTLARQAIPACAPDRVSWSGPCRSVWPTLVDVTYCAGARLPFKQACPARVVPLRGAGPLSRRRKPPQSFHHSVVWRNARSSAPEIRSRENSRSMHMNSMTPAKSGSPNLMS
jgi:hypothetical protein